MLYAYLAMAVSIFLAGFGLSHQIDKAEIQGLQMAIERGNAEADMVMQSALHKVDQANIKAAQVNQQLEESHAQSINTINILHDRIATVSLQRPGKTYCSSSVSGSSSAGIAKTEATISDISAGFDGFLKDRFYQADQVAEYADACYQFVVESNCGIGKQ